MIKNAVIISIGDELLAGKTLNTNAFVIAEAINDHDINVLEMSTISDEANDIRRALDQSIPRADIIIMAGGLGPTHDDITVPVLAAYFDQKLIFHGDTYEAIVRRLLKQGRNATDAHRNQCMLPEGAEILANELGTAPGLRFVVDDTWIYAMPGVPSEMNFLLTTYIIPDIQALQGIQTRLQKIYRTAGVSEAHLAGLLEQTIKTMSNDMKLVFLPSLGEVKIRLCSQNNSLKAAAQFNAFSESVEQSIKEYIYGYDEDSLVSVLGDLLVSQSKSIATAESCTGGLLAHQIVSQPGSSRYFLGSTVTYQNELKSSWLDVESKTILNHGAVSEEVVMEMLDGILGHSHADIGVAISGIAGPTGGTAEKPVGTIWVALGSKSDKITHRLNLGTDRMQNIQYACAFCLNQLIKFLKKY